LSPRGEKATKYSQQNENVGNPSYRKAVEAADTLKLEENLLEVKEDNPGGDKTLFSTRFTRTLSPSERKKISSELSGSRGEVPIDPEEPENISVAVTPQADPSISCITELLLSTEDQETHFVLFLTFGMYTTSEDLLLSLFRATQLESVHDLEKVFPSWIKCRIQFQI
jgi:hypothetical protein